VAVIAMVSASGSPGVTTTALGLALAWPRPVMLVDADPTGGSSVLAGYFHGDVPHTGGLLEVALAHRDGNLADGLPYALLPIPGSDVQFLPGVRSHEQSRALRDLWEPLLAELSDLQRTGQDVIVDAGRLGLVGSAEPVVHGADVTFLLTRSDLPALAGARSWAGTLRQESSRVGPASRLQVLLVGDGRPYGEREVSSVLRLPVLTSVAWDPAAASVFSRGAPPPRRFEASRLARSLRGTASAVRSVLAQQAAQVGGPRPTEAPAGHPAVGDRDEQVTAP